MSDIQVDGPVDPEVIPVDVECPNCNGERIPAVRMGQHRRRHARDNLLSHIRELVISDFAVPPFGPAQPGHFFETGFKYNKNLMETGYAKDIVGKSLPSSLRQRPFATLRYVEGQKYTFGNKFVSRQSQGEFVYLNLDFPKEENYFNLECTDECIWISPEPVLGLNSTVVYVNGVALESVSLDTVDAQATSSNEKETTKTSPLSFRRKLVFGDVLTISIGSESETSGFGFYVFQGSARPKKGDAQNELNEGTLVNPLVVRNILLFLPTQKVKDLRLVSHVWSDEALKVLRENVIITFWLGRVWDTTDALMQFSNYAYSPLNNLNFPHWRIHLSEDSEHYGHDDPQSHKKTMRDKKVLEDLVWFFDSNLKTPNVQSLRLAGTVESNTSMTMFEKLLCGVRNTLTTLTLEKMNWFCNVMPSSMNSFPHLQSLSLSFFDKPVRPWQHRPPHSQIFLQRVIQWFIPAMRNIQVLHLTNYSPYVLEEVGKNQAEFVNLTNITIDSTNLSDPELRPLSLLHQGTLITYALKKLDLGQLHPSAASTPLLSVLERHADSLEELTLRIELRPHLTFNIHFPQAMRKLKTLSVFLRFDLSHAGWLYRLRDDAAVGFKFGRTLLHPDDPNASPVVTKIDYRRRFPCLSKLTVNPVDSYRYASIVGGPPRVESVERPNWETFLPLVKGFLRPTIDDEDGRNIPATSLQFVDIPFVLGRKYHNFLDTLETTFPNVNFPPALAAARQGPVWGRDDSSGSEEDEDGFRPPRRDFIPLQRRIFD